MNQTLKTIISKQELELKMKDEEINLLNKQLEDC